MSNELNEVRSNVLAQIEAVENRYKFAFVAAALAEAVFLGLFILLADFSERLHVLLLIAAVAIYTIVAFGLIALGLHVTRNTLRVIRAIEASSAK
jgi:uncharacterized membrane protein (DUF485 family)